MSDFTTQQQAQIRAFLGYPSLNRYKNTRLEGVIAGTGVLDADTIALVLGWITKLQDIDTAIASSGLSTAGLKKVDEIEFYPSGGSAGVVEGQRKIGRSYITRISTALGVPIYGDYYGSQGYPGDKYSAGGLGTSDRGGNIIPLG